MYDFNLRDIYNPSTPTHYELEWRKSHPEEYEQELLDLQQQIEREEEFEDCPDYEDLFYIGDSSITQVYYNPDSFEGGSYIINCVSWFKILEIEKIAISTEDFWDRFERIADQWWIDRGTQEFKNAEKEFEDYESADFIDRTDETRARIVALARKEMGEDV